MEKIKVPPGEEEKKEEKRSVTRSNDCLLSIRRSLKNRWMKNR